MAGLLSSLFGRSSVPIPLLLTHLASLPFPRSLFLALSISFGSIIPTYGKKIKIISNKKLHLHPTYQWFLSMGYYSYLANKEQHHTRL